MYLEDKRKERRHRLGDKFAEIFLLNRKKRDESGSVQKSSLDSKMHPPTPVKRESSFEGGMPLNPNTRFPPQNQSKLKDWKIFNLLFSLCILVNINPMGGGPPQFMNQNMMQPGPPNFNQGFTRTGIKKILKISTNLFI